MKAEELKKIADDYNKNNSDAQYDKIKKQMSVAALKGGYSIMVSQLLEIVKTRLIAEGNAVSYSNCGYDDSGYKISWEKTKEPIKKSEPIDDNTWVKGQSWIEYDKKFNGG